MPRNADNILIGGMRLFITEGEGDDKVYNDLGWLSGEFKMEETGDATTIKESEGGTVLTLNQNKEAHFTFSLLECNPETILKLNPSATAVENDTETGGKGFAVGTFQSDKTFPFEAWMKKRSGKFLCIKLFRAQVSGGLTTFLMNQDSESPISVDIIALPDESKGTGQNLYLLLDDIEAAKAPNGGW